MAILRKTETKTPTTSTEDTRRSIFLNDTDGKPLGFLNMSSHFEDSSFEVVVHNLTTNFDSFTFEEGTNSKGKFIQVNTLEETPRVIGFLNTKKYIELINAINMRLLTFNIELPPVTADTVKEYFSFIR